MSAQPTVVVGSRVRNENASPLKGGLSNILFSVGSIGIGAVAGYFIADYIAKNDLANKLLKKVGLEPGTADTKPAGDVNTGDDDNEAANLAYITPLWPEVTDTGDTFDRITRHTTGMAGKVAYPAKRLFTKYYDPLISENAGEFNQIATDNEIYE